MRRRRLEVQGYDAESSYELRPKAIGTKVYLFIYLFIYLLNI
jgi:hypothetical protein